MKVTLTGATGFIGSHILADLQAHGHEVTALVRDEAQAETVAAQLRDRDITRFALLESDPATIWVFQAAASLTGSEICVYPIAAVASGPNPDAARKFLDFVLTPAAQTVLARYGFGKP